MGTGGRRAVHPISHLGLDSRDAVGSPTMTSWPLRRTGGTLTTLTPLSGQEPQVGSGIVRNGIAGVPVSRRRPREASARARSTGHRTCGASAPSRVGRGAFIVAANFRSVPVFDGTTPQRLDSTHRSVRLGGGDRAISTTTWAFTGRRRRRRSGVGHRARRRATRLRTIHLRASPRASSSRSTSMASLRRAAHRLSVARSPGRRGTERAPRGAGPITTASGHSRSRNDLERVWMDGPAARRHAARDRGRGVEPQHVRHRRTTWTPATIRRLTRGRTRGAQSVDRRSGSAPRRSTSGSSQSAPQIGIASGHHRREQTPRTGPAINGYVNVFDGTTTSCRTGRDRAGIITAFHGAAGIYMVVSACASRSANKGHGRGCRMQCTAVRR